MHIFSHDWRLPLSVLPALAQQFPDMALLYSGMQTSYSGSDSWLGVDMEETVESNSADSFTYLSTTPAIQDRDGRPIPQWIGCISYELGDAFLGITPIATPTKTITPLIRFSRYKRLFHFHHASQTLTEYTTHCTPFIWPEDSTIDSVQLHMPARSALISNMSKNDYLTHIHNTLKAIARGDFYQANITRKFATTYAHTPSSQSMAYLFIQLAHQSPAPYSAFIQWEHPDHPIRILSSSPELFFNHFPAQENALTTRPIKGTMPLEASPEALAKSIKNQAENLMIVDLMRNDFSKIAELGSVKTPILFDIDSFSTLHHLSSTVTATPRKHTSLFDIIQACFPAGSMTGAPKRKVMQWCQEVERVPRGIYSGALGWISGNACEFSVVIRTIIQQREHVEFQVGGGIVADSTPEDEWRETLIKARAMCNVLDIPAHEIETI